jgi:predicted nuclease of predicted toxin-antitoxin system
LRNAGIDCLHVGELGMAAAEDSEIMAWARKEGVTVVTLDADFHEMLVLHKQSSPSVIRIRMEGLDGPAVANLLIPVVNSYAGELAAGCMITIESHKLTCRLLPR